MEDELEVVLSGSGGGAVNVPFDYLASEGVWIAFDTEPSMLSCHQTQCHRCLGSPRQVPVEHELLIHGAAA